jgi:nucleotide-binding universal stress UspA family protein
VGGAPLLDKIKQLASSTDQTAMVHVVSPALNSPLRHLASDEDTARAAAHERLENSLGKLREEGIEASGEVGDGDPLQAIEDALRTFGADQIVISTHPEGRSNWLERGLVTQARERFAVPVDHVVVDLGDRP